MNLMRSLDEYEQLLVPARQRFAVSPGIQPIQSNSDDVFLELFLARPRLRPARGIRQFDCAGRGAAGFSGLAHGGTEILMRGKCLGAIIILRLLFHWRVPAKATPIKIK